MILFKATFAALAAVTIGYLTIPTANAYDPCERCYKQYDACIAASTAHSKCKPQLATCSQRYCTL